MSIQKLEKILLDFKQRGLRYIDIKSDKKVEYVLQDFIFVLTGLTSSKNIFDILYIDNNKLNVLEDARYQYIIIRKDDNYSIIDTNIINYPTNELLK